MNTIINWIIKVTKPYIWRFAELYGFRIDRHCFQSGQHPLIIEDDSEQAKHHIPKSVYFNTRCGSIFVGENSVFGEDVMVLTGKHMNIQESENAKVELHHVPEDSRDIVIGKGCYIGSRAIIIGPINIGDFAVIGAGSVVTNSVAKGEFVAGVPAKVVQTLKLPDL